MSKRIDLANKSFGNLLVLSFSHVKNTQAHWKVRCLLCDCTVIVSVSNLQSGNTTACQGCNMIGFTREQRDEIVRRIETNKEKINPLAKELGCSRHKIDSLLKKMKKGREEKIAL